VTPIIRAADVRVAFIRDWLTVYAGADRVMEPALELFPQAPIYTLVYQPENFRDTPIARHPVHVSFIDRLPWGRSRYRAYLPLMPLAIEQFDLGEFDVVISMSHSVAKGVLTRSDQLHISYMYTPVRYGWDLYFQYLRDLKLERGIRSWLVRPLLHYLRLWDLASASRPDVMIASSGYVAQRIWKLYRREAPIIYPPVETERFQATRRRDSFYLTLARLVPYKRVDLIVEAFSRLRLPLVVVGDGPDRQRVQRLAGPTIVFRGEQPDATVTDLMERCKAFVFAADEDFGIAPVEAQAAGAPVIAYGRGGITETVVPGETGLLYPQQTVESLMAAVRAFESGEYTFQPQRLRLSSERFSRTRFQRELLDVVEREWAAFQGRRRGASATAPLTRAG
jgi:glycosyltransferase involved in cell wall biosynthesis